MVLEGLGGPDAELGTALGFHPVADRNDDVQIKVLGTVLLAVRGSRQGFLDDCFLSELSGFSFLALGEFCGPGVIMGLFQTIRLRTALNPTISILEAVGF